MEKQISYHLISVGSETGKYWESYPVNLKGRQIKKEYEKVAKLVRWVIVGLATLVVAMPLFISFGAYN